MKTVGFVFLLLLIVMIVDLLWIKKGDTVKKKREDHLEQIIMPRVNEDQNLSVKETNETEVPPAQSLEENITIAPPQLTMTEQLSGLGAEIGDPVFIRIFKYTAELELWIKVGKRYELLQTYEICRQSGYLGPKLKEGDKQGPEGFYAVTKSRLNPNSKFHLAFNIGYPNTYDRAYHRTGSALMIHGDCVSVGCFAMTDEKIEEIYELVEKALDDGQKVVRVHIFPFRMTDAKMEQYRSSEWFDFWSNLKEGYDYFEEKGVPPNVEVKKRKYIFD